jgi:hypothetical protein
MATNTVRSTDDQREIVWILVQLGQRLPQLRDNPLYFASIPHYLSIGAYKFFVGSPGAVPGEIEDATAFGFVTFYRSPMQERIVLAVEAFWFADHELAAQLPVWRAIVSLTKKMEFHGVCISERSVNTPDALQELVRRGELDGDPVVRERTLLQADDEAIYSAFSDGPLETAAFLAPCVRIFTLRVPVDLAGVPCMDDGPFYRGEGRLINMPHWVCRDVGELGSRFMQHGFSARKFGQFTGTVQDQILQQGYVNQATVSLTKSFDVAAYYATNGKTRDQALVFTIDGARLRRHGEIYDSFATMVKYCDWIFPGEFESLRGTVKALGVLKAGRFLNKCYEQTKLRVARYGHLPAALSPAIDWDNYVNKDDWDDLAHAGITKDTLRGLLNAFEVFWMYALGQIGATDTITVGTEECENRIETKPAEPFGYYIGFCEVLDLLKVAMEGETADHRQPGWDLTAFGYIAKTCRDEEFFSSGDVPGDCIVKATVVEGRRL